MDDDELIMVAARGGDTALRALSDRHAPWLAARLRTALPPPDVEDVRQDTFLAVWRGSGGYRPGNGAAGCGGSPAGRPRCGCVAAPVERRPALRPPRRLWC
jgi:RNA polymerase sigma-70 factor (ECF subfamily)